MKFKSRWTYIATRYPIINLKSFTSKVTGPLTSREIYEAITKRKSISVSGECREILCEYIKDVRNMTYFTGITCYGVVVLGQYTPDESIINKLNTFLDYNEAYVNSPDFLCIEGGMTCIRIGTYAWQADEILISSLIILLESGVLSGIKLLNKKETIKFLVEVFCDMVNIYSEEAENLAFSALYLAMFLKFSQLLVPTGSGPISYITRDISATMFFRLKDLIESNLSEERLRELRVKLYDYSLLSNI